MTAPAQLAVIGDCTVDYTVELPPNPSADEKIIPLRTHRALGGTAANSAAAAHSLGSAVTVHGSVGDDADGVWVLGELRRRGIDSSAISVRPGTTARATILLRGSEREVIVDIGVGLQVTPLDQVALADADLIYVSYSPDAVVELVNHGLGHKTVAGFEAWMVERGDFRVALGSCRLLVTNQIGWEALGAHDCVPRVPAVQTLGEEGAAIHGPDGSTAHVSAHAVEVVDATGAGDCFAGTLCHYVASGYELPKAVQLASIAGALATTAVGSQGWLPTEPELERHLGDIGPHPRP